MDRCTRNLLWHMRCRYQDPVTMIIDLLFLSGNRDVVGYGFNGTASYMDRTEFPCPAIRFGENTQAVMALREKEKGDWSKLSIEDKKACMY